MITDFELTLGNFYEVFYKDQIESVVFKFIGYMPNTKDDNVYGEIIGENAGVYSINSLLKNWKKIDDLGTFI